MFGEYVFCPGKQLFTGVAVGIPERYIGNVLPATPGDFFVFNVTCHPPERYAQFVDGIVIKLMHMEAVVCDGGFGE